jgi:hypothetical protein
MARRTGNGGSHHWQPTSLRFSLSRLQEAEHFLGEIVSADWSTFAFNLNGFLSACFSSTEIASRSLARVPSFKEWFKARKAALFRDPTAKFFVSLRHRSTHEGPVSYLSGSFDRSPWSFHFVDQSGEMPGSLAERDLRECCAEHLSKLAGLMVECFERFPFHACPGHAYTEDGMKALGYSRTDAVVAAGFPPAWADAGASIPVGEFLRILSREIEPLDVEELRRLANGDFRRGEEKLVIPRTASNFVRSLAANLSRQPVPPPNAIIATNPTDRK